MQLKSLRDNASPPAASPLSPQGPWSRGRLSSNYYLAASNAARFGRFETYARRGLVSAESSRDTFTACRLFIKGEASQYGLVATSSENGPRYT